MAPDKEMGQGHQGHLKNCMASLKAETGAQDVPPGARLRPAPLQIMRAQDSIEQRAKSTAAPTRAYQNMWGVSGW